ncbi:hypothetical protein SELMODRAFT_447911 [Selaginella moellendorffii]|uniref:Uncharacterized protein n=1 Tax=Selaginella moellendorffii TaxID=88036 RepID=D8T3E4_SELML|nr:uncharacterized protein LOC9647300 [Selaginella moellendorffii]EFJ08816.1 hypothetical protein SELMODRAFT_447911 [Selaginella moellendorffii]|eukprot:XP_002990099.1 uncharacterized protein LOC9647300 [Selaginella moellendorffii]
MGTSALSWSAGVGFRVLGCRASAEKRREVRVCTHTTCRKSGSLQTLQALQNLAPAAVSVESCGCLGRCGSGPNLVLLPDQLLVSYCNTPAHAARFLDVQCGASNPESNLAAFALAQKGDKAVDLGQLEQAYDHFTHAIELNPSGGLHYIYAKRSAVLVAMDDPEAGLADAKMAAELHPDWPVAFVRQADAYTKMAQFDAARHYLSLALGLDPSLRRSKSFQRKLLQVEKQLLSVNA